MRYMRKFLALYFFLVFAISDLSASVLEPYDPISVYLTFNQDPHRKITVQWITYKNRTDDTILYRRADTSAWRMVKGTHFPLPGNTPYFIHRIELVNLEPGEEYLFRTGEDAKTYKFRTIPLDPNIPIRFVVGGDVYHDSLNVLEETNRKVAQLNPMFAVLGGDLAYAADKYGFFSEKVNRWIEWLHHWKETMVTRDGRLIPMVPLIGNHDVNGRYNQTPAQAPYFYALFIPKGEKSYRVLDIGNQISFFLLDSAHTHAIGGEQSHWLEKKLSQRKEMKHKIAVYHVPAYPSVRNFNNKISPQVRAHWVPLFEDYGLNVAFENHDHAYKRTHPIFQNRVSPQGVVYLGDGAWGVDQARHPRSPNNTWYLAQSKSSRNFIYVSLSQQQRDFIALNPKGEIIDIYSQQVTPEVASFSRI